MRIEGFMNESTYTVDKYLFYFYSSYLEKIGFDAGSGPGIIGNWSL